MPVKTNITKRRLLRVLAGIMVIILILIVIFRIMVYVPPPKVENKSILSMKVAEIDKDHFEIGDSWLRKDTLGLWEMYITGNPFELGAKNGKLIKNLIFIQEEAFIGFIKEMIPNEIYLRSIRYFISWFNRSLDNYIPLEYQQEIYGISFNASDEFSFIGDNYIRILNYHAAHDVGHALQNMNLVECTSFGIWDAFSVDSSIIIGRNFDFYAGEDFAENKIVAFVHPENGYDFASVTWAGMIGVLSGMNMEGLTITINSAKSDIPYSAKTPVSIVARNILQYASTIEEAFSIAKGLETFVSESFLVGSANDHKVAIIEKSLDTCVLYSQETDYVIASNHFQDEAFANEKLNRENIANETSAYRYRRVDELLHQNDKPGVANVAEILRDQKGIHDKDIGMGNEKSINQLIAHHAVIFKPEQKLMWVSTAPYLLGRFICFDLNRVFDPLNPPDIQTRIAVDSLEIPEDIFLHSTNYIDYLLFKDFNNETRNDDFSGISEAELMNYMELNQENYYTYVKAGDYYYWAGNNEKSLEFYKFALQKEVSSKAERELILKKIESLNGNTSY